MSVRFEVILTSDTHPRIRAVWLGTATVQWQSQSPAHGTWHEADPSFSGVPVGKGEWFGEYPNLDEVVEFVHDAITEYGDDI